MIEFADNDALSRATQMTPFFFNYGHHPRMSFGPTSKEYLTTRERLQTIQADDIANKMQEILKVGRENVAQAQEAMRIQANRHRQPSNINVGDQVMLDGKGLQTDRPSKKLDDVRHGPFPVVKNVGHSFQLQLPETAKIHDVFSPDQLTKHPNPDLPPLPGQVNPPPPPVIINDEEEWEIDEILASRYHYHRLQYKVKWSGDEKDNTWYYADEDEFENAQDVIDEYHRKYPSRPGPELTRKK